MGTLTLPPLTPDDVARASERDGKRYELIDGELREKPVGAEALYIALRIAQRFSSAYDPDQGFSGTTDEFAAAVKSARGFYRPMAMCRMRSPHAPFCRVCAYVLTAAVEAACRGQRLDRTAVGGD